MKREAREMGGRGRENSEAVENIADAGTRHSLSTRAVAIKRARVTG